MPTQHFGVSPHVLADRRLVDRVKLDKLTRLEHAVEERQADCIKSLALDHLGRRANCGSRESIVNTARSRLCASDAFRAWADWTFPDPSRICAASDSLTT